MIISVKTLPHFLGLSFPKYETEGAAGMDVCAAIEAGKDISIWPGERKLIPTGLKVSIPRDYEIQVRGRSGLALREGIVVCNSPGTIDSDYRGEIGVILLNTNQPQNTDQPFIVKRGMRIAQLVMAPVTRIEWQMEFNELSETDRGEGGFGSSGV